MFLILPAAVAGFFLASLLAVYSYGRFARTARGRESFALPLAETSALDQFVAPFTRAHAGETGMELLAGNLEAFAFRVRMARRCGRSLDLQYYIWDDDLTGRLLLQEVLDAADRGVRVRLLLDDVNAQGRDRALRGLATHPNIEVRVFNPVRCRRRSLRRGLELLLRAWRANHRMHNKAWIADGRVAVVGSRNIGDKYFDADQVSNFRDLDVIVVGDAVAHAEATFDLFWNSTAVIPIQALHRRRVKLRKVRRRLAAFRAQGAALPYLARVANDESVQALLAADGPRHWVRDARLVSDPPEKCEGGVTEKWLRTTVGPLLLAANQRLTIVSAYFIPGAGGTAVLLDRVRQGVRVSVLTNSLAATDVALVHGAYARYRRRLVDGGVRLHELKPYRRRRRIALFGSSAASLHTKAFTVDGLAGFVGSMNFDPRSIVLNTEMGIAFSCPPLAAEIDAVLEEEMAPQRSYRLTVEDGRLTWRDHTEGGARVQHAEPDAGTWRRAIAIASRLLPIEAQL